MSLLVNTQTLKHLSKEINGNAILVLTVHVQCCRITEQQTSPRTCTMHSIQHEPSYGNKGEIHKSM